MKKMKNNLKLNLIVINFKNSKLKTIMRIMKKKMIRNKMMMER